MGRRTTSGELLRITPDTLRIESLAHLGSEKGRNHYVSRGAVSAEGTMIFGKILASPAGVYRVRVDDHPKKLTTSDYQRLWG